MSLLTNLFRLVPPSFRAGYCPKSYQEAVRDAIGGTRVTMLIQTGNFLYNYGPTTPTEDNRIFPWLNTTNGRWWNFQFGVWTAPHWPPAGPNGLRMEWTETEDGALSGLWKFDGGDGTDPRVTLPGGGANPAYVAPTAITGAMWEVDHLVDGRMSIAPGTIPTSSPSASVAVKGTQDSEGNSGEYTHTLTADEGSVEGHEHYMGLTNQEVTGNADDAYFRLTAKKTVPTYTGFYITGGGTRVEAAQTQADLAAMQPVDVNGDPLVTTGHNNMPPYYGLYKIKRTSRVWDTLPA